MRRVAFLSLSLALLGAACAGSSGPPVTSTESGGSGSQSAGATLLAASAPLLPTDAFALPTATSESFDALLRQLRGTPVLVNVWGSWCGPCRSEAPDLAKASERYGTRVQFLGLDILDDRDSARGFMREFGWRYPSLYDAPGRVRDGLGFVGQPVTILYDRDGNQAWVWNGPSSFQMLDQQLSKVV